MVPSGFAALRQKEWFLLLLENDIPARTSGVMWCSREFNDPNMVDTTEVAIQIIRVCIKEGMLSRDGIIKVFRINHTNRGPGSCLSNPGMFGQVGRTRIARTSQMLLSEPELANLVPAGNFVEISHMLRNVTLVVRIIPEAVIKVIMMAITEANIKANIKVNVKVILVAVSHIHSTTILSMVADSP